MCTLAHACAPVSTSHGIVATHRFQLEKIFAFHTGVGVIGTGGLVRKQTQHGATAPLLCLLSCSLGGHGSSEKGWAWCPAREVP